MRSNEGERIINGEVPCQSRRPNSQSEWISPELDKGYHQKPFLGKKNSLWKKKRRRRRRREKEKKEKQE